MINYWWVTRPKRRLNSVPEILAVFSEISLNQEWFGQRGTHLTLEEALEEANLKRKGERRDQTGGGARTYQAWLVSLGLLFTHEATNTLKLTLAGEAIMAGDSPVAILKGQIIKRQFPSSYSLSRNINVSQRFKIRPFRFIFKLLTDKRLNGIGEEEIAKIVIIEAENETNKCYEHIVERILSFREMGGSCLEKDFFEKYPPGKGVVNEQNPFGNLKDVANTIMNWVEYTQLAKRDEYDKRLRIIPEKINRVVRKLQFPNNFRLKTQNALRFARLGRQPTRLANKFNELSAILAETPNFIDRPEQQEYFQRKFGLDPKHKKDARNLAKTKTITATIITEHKVRQAFIGESLKSPIGKITPALIDKITEITGIEAANVEEVLTKNYPRGAIGSFMTEYFEMAFRGRDDATEFEKATAEIFKTVMGFKAIHTGPIGLTPDVLILSDNENFCGIIDNKAYAKYTISNDHHNRMVINYIQGLQNYYKGSAPLAFFSYIAGGFAHTINTQLKNIVDKTSIHGSAITVSNMINRLVNNPVGCLTSLVVFQA
ncbi:MAG: hypothetical protein LBC53_09655 [Spirochaetaceae bacterium]|jgi:hypothetical protein|nr:hypothetical protein [Spirochaetaceae bacterium]